MAVEIPGIQYSFEAGADLRLYQYCFVKLSAGKVVACDATTDCPIGILQNNPNNGQMATVMVCGVSKIKAHAALALDTFVGTEHNATGAPYVHGTATTSYIVGQTIEACSNPDEYATIAFNCLGVGRAA